MHDPTRPVVQRMPIVGAIGIGAHLLLLVWLAPIAFFDDGRLGLDWAETLVPFGALTLPLVVAAASRSFKGFMAAGVLALACATIMFIGPGIFLLVPALCYLTAAGRTQ